MKDYICPTNLLCDLGLATWTVDVKTFFRNPVVAFFSSLKLGAFLLVVAGIACGRGTFIESFYGGRDAAYDQIYAARWFEVLLGLIMLNLLLTFFKRMPYKRRQTGAALIHLSIVVILLASGITRFFGYEGVLPIREGQSTDYYYTVSPHVQVSFGGQTGSYPVRLYRTGDPGLSETVKAGGQAFELGVADYWPHFAETYQVGEDGQPGFWYEMSRNGSLVDDILLKGDRSSIGQVRAWFRHDPFSTTPSQSPFGDIRVRVGGATCTFAVGLPDGSVRKCGGYEFEVTEFQADFKVNGGTSSAGPVTNPMIRVAITAPDGRTGEKVLFAFHPDFSASDQEGEADFSALDIFYTLNRGIEFYHSAESGLQARASFGLQVLGADNTVQQEIPTGEIFAVAEQMLYVNESADFHFNPVTIAASVVLAPTNSDNTDLPGAARVTLRDEQGNEGSAICIKGRPGQNLQVGETAVKLAFGPLVHSLPYSLYLDRFHLETYPGSDNPATFESFVLLTDPEMGIENQKVHIQMNHPLTHRGSKHFQSSYDKDRQGTVLTLNHDPGKLPTYFGYALISLGFVFFILQNLIWPRRKSETGGSGAGDFSVLTGLLLGFIAFGAVGGAVAQEAAAHNSHGGGNFLVLTDQERDVASRLLIQDYRGRMKPLDTLAREFVMKVAKKTKFQGQQPVDMYLNWVANTSHWWNEPCVAVRYGGLKEMLGVDASVKHVSPASLFVGNEYRLTALVEKALRTPDRERTKSQRKLLSFDERFNLLYMTFKGTTLRMYPVPGDANNTWLDIQGTLPRLNHDQAQRYNTAYDDLVGGLRTGNHALILQGLRETGAIQQEHGAAVIPSDLKLGAELFYNKSHLFSWMMVPLLGTFFIFIALFLWNLFKNRGARFSFRNPLYSLAMFAYTFAFGGMVLAYTLRWIASGRAPLSNGHESLLFISLIAALAGLIFEWVFRLAAPAGLASLLTTLILGVSMLSVFDPAIGPLVPVLASYWLNIHVTIITASYSFLGLAFMVGLLIMVLMIIRGRGGAAARSDLDESIQSLDDINFWILAVGLGTLSIGTLLGGVWANEAWGRYWGWDPKETWSLITILVVAIGLHFRYIPALKGAWITSAWTWLVFNSVIMTYFGVNYFLTGLHSYASGDSAQVPGGVYVFSAVMVVLVVVSGVLNLSYRKAHQLAGD